jgi:hypothetical protein
MQNVSGRSRENRAFPLLRNSCLSGQSGWNTWTAGKFMETLLRQCFEIICNIFHVDELLLSVHFSDHKNFIPQTLL